MQTKDYFYTIIPTRFGRLNRRGFILGLIYHLSLGVFTLYILFKYVLIGKLWEGNSILALIGVIIFLCLFVLWLMLLLNIVERRSSDIAAIGSEEQVEQTAIIGDDIGFAGPPTLSALVYLLELPFLLFLRTGKDLPPYRYRYNPIDVLGYRYDISYRRYVLKYKQNNSRRMNMLHNKNDAKDRANKS